MIAHLCILLLASFSTQNNSYILNAQRHSFTFNKFSSSSTPTKPPPPVEDEDSYSEFDTPAKPKARPRLTEPFPPSQTPNDLTYEEMFLKRRTNELLESPIELRASELNDLFRPPPGLGRNAETIKPDSSFGAIIRLENALVSINEVQLRAWNKVAKDNNFQEVTIEEVAMAQTMSPEFAIRRVFYWTNDFLACRNLGLEHFMVLSDLFEELGEEGGLEIELVEGAMSWLEQLQAAEIPAVVISRLDERKVDKIIDSLNIRHLLHTSFVSAETGYETESQEFLGASLRIQKPPDHCMVYDTSPSATIAAHDSDMRFVALNNVYPSYELSGSDLIVKTYQELNLQNVRKLFGDRDYDLEVEQEVDDGDGGREGGGDGGGRWSVSRNKRW